MKYVSTKISPQVKGDVAAQNEEQAILREFNDEFKDLPGGPDRWVDMVNGIMRDISKTKTFDSPQALYEEAKTEFQKMVQPKKEEPQKPERKVVPLESPSKAKEKALKKKEPETTDYDEWASKDRPDYISWRRKKFEEISGGAP